MHLLCSHRQQQNRNILTGGKGKHGLYFAMKQFYKPMFMADILHSSPSKCPCSPYIGQKQANRSKPVTPLSSSRIHSVRLSRIMQPTCPLFTKNYIYIYTHKKISMSRWTKFEEAKPACCISSNCSPIHPIPES